MRVLSVVVLGLMFAVPSFACSAHVGHFHHLTSGSKAVARPIVKVGKAGAKGLYKVGKFIVS